MIKQSAVGVFRPKKVNIKGKDYITVAERIKLFYKACETQGVDGSIQTFLVQNEGGSCMFEARILINDKLIATGHAMEEKDSSTINRTSFLEVCETSAVGRALGFAGIGIDSDVASAEEVVNASIKQEVLQAREISSRYYCSKCGKPVTATKNRSIENIVEGTKKTYGKILCVDCALEEGKAVPKVEEEETGKEQVSLFQEVING